MAKMKGSGGLEVICAGFPKTGTKSLYEALKIMGYKHYEVPDVFTHMLDDWLKDEINDLRMQQKITRQSLKTI